MDEENILSQQKRAKESKEARGEPNRPGGALEQKASQRLDGTWQNEIGEDILPPDPETPNVPLVRTGIRQNPDGSYVDQFGNPTRPSAAEFPHVNKLKSEEESES